MLLNQKIKPHSSTYRSWAKPHESNVDCCKLQKIGNTSANKQIRRFYILKKR